MLAAHTHTYTHSQWERYDGVGGVRGDGSGGGGGGSITLIKFVTTNANTTET